MSDIYSLALVFTGHMTDAPKRNTVRFPEKMAELVRDEIRCMLKQLYDQHDSMIVISSAARGADLIFIEEAQKMGIPNRIVLPFAEEEFIERSVVGTLMGCWKRRFLLAMDLTGFDNVENLCGDDEDILTFHRCNVAMWELAENLGRRQTLMSFWDEADKLDFAPGGTGHFVDYVIKGGGQHLNINAKHVLQRYFDIQEAQNNPDSVLFGF